MALNEEEKAAIRYYMGYPSVAVSASISLGLPDKTQLNFVLEINMQNVLEHAEPRVRRSLQELECIEAKISSVAREGLEVRAVVGSVQLRNSDALFDLQGQYSNWVATLADILASPVNPFSNRLNQFGYSALGGGVNEPM